MHRFYQITKNLCLNVEYRRMGMWGFIIIPTLTIDVRKDLYTLSIYFGRKRLEMTLFIPK